MITSCTLHSSADAPWQSGMRRAELEYEAALERRRQELEAERQRAEQEMLRWVGLGIIPRVTIRSLLLAMRVSPSIDPFLGACLGRACCCTGPGAGADFAAGALPMLPPSNAAWRAPAMAGAFAVC